MKTGFYIFLFILQVFRTIGQSCLTNGKEYFIYEDIKAILHNNKCNSCHNVSSSQTKWRYDTYETIFTTGSCAYPVIRHGDASSSTLYQVLNGNSPVCFSGFHAEHQMSGADKEKIEAWINFGAPEECVIEYEELKSIFNSNQCNSCHNSNQKSGGWSYDTYEELFVENGINCPETKNIEFFNAEASQLYLKLSPNHQNQCGSKMPIQGTPMPAEEVAKIRDWINASAPFNAQALPVSLVYFTATEIDEQTIEIDWKAETEINTDKYIIERSRNSFEFEKIGEVVSSGSNTSTYTFADKDAKAGINYYRLKIVEKNLKYEYSPIRFTNLKSNSLIFDLWPNPSRSNQKVMLEWYSKKNRQNSASIELIDLAGRKLQKYYIENGYNELLLPNLSAGVYMLVVNDFFGTAHWERIIVLDP